MFPDFYRLSLPNSVNRLVQNTESSKHTLTNTMAHMHLYRKKDTNDVNFISDIRYIEYSDDDEVAVCNLASICLPQFIKYDEVIFSYDDIKSLHSPEILEIINNESYNVKIFKTDIKEDFRINIYLDFYEEELYKELTGCNGSKYFIFLKKYILNESLDVRDLYFRMDGDLAIWNIDGLKIELND